MHHSAVRLGDCLPTLMGSTRALPSAMIDCGLCGKHGRPSISTGVCLRCFRAMEWKVLPDSEKERRLLALVHERYLRSSLADLPEAMVKEIRSAPEQECIFIWGPEGRGKTYAAAALAREWLAAGYTVEREKWFRLCLRLQDTMNPHATETQWTVIQPLLVADKLILEDIGTVVSVGRLESDFSLRTLLLILDDRCEDCLQTVMTSNKPVEEIARSFDPRVASRIRQGTIIHKTGEDHRIRKDKHAGGK